MHPTLKSDLRPLTPSNAVPAQPTTASPFAPRPFFETEDARLTAGSRAHNGKGLSQSNLLLYEQQQDTESVSKADIAQSPSAEPKSPKGGDFVAAALHLGEKHQQDAPKEKQAETTQSLTQEDESELESSTPETEEEEERH